MPSRVTLPFIQNHSTRGLAAIGGWRNASRNVMAGVSACRPANNPTGVTSTATPADEACLRKVRLSMVRMLRVPVRPPGVSHRRLGAWLDHQSKISIR